MGEVLPGSVIVHIARGFQSQVEEWGLAVALLAQRVPHTRDEASGSVISRLFKTLQCVN